jgi:hypothetical protein
MLYTGVQSSLSRIANYTAKIRQHTGTGSAPDYTAPVIQRKLAGMSCSHSRPSATRSRTERTIPSPRFPRHRRRSSGSGEKQGCFARRPLGDSSPRNAPPSAVQDVASITENAASRHPPLWITPLIRPQTGRTQWPDKAIMQLQADTTYCCPALGDKLQIVENDTSVADWPWAICRPVW